MSEPSAVTELMGVIAARRADPSAERSYVATLLKGGPAKILGKIAEEAAELIAAGDEPGDDGQTHRVREAADLIFHACVLLGRYGVAWPDVEAELARRAGTSGIAEKESRPRPV